MNKISKAVAAVVVAAGLVLGGGLTAQGVYGNKVVNYRSDCLTVRTDLGNNLSTCGYGSYVGNVSYVVVPRSQCRQIGTWSFKTYCASGKVNLLVPVGSGTTYVR